MCRALHIRGYLCTTYILTSSPVPVPLRHRPHYDGGARALESTLNPGQTLPLSRAFRLRNYFPVAPSPLYNSLAREPGRQSVLQVPALRPGFLFSKQEHS